MIKLGKPCHLLTKDGASSECGVPCPDYGAHDARDVDCLRCMRGKRYKVYMNKSNKAHSEKGIGSWIQRNS